MEKSRLLPRGVDLNKKVGKEYFDTAFPHFFTGNIHAELVLVHLNPKRNESSWGIKWNEERKWSNFGEYWEHFAHFGEKHYGVDNPTHKSNFDHKQVRFLKPFDENHLFGFNEDKYHNLKVAIDKKLQLELVPFGSPNFNYNEIGIENIEPFIERLIDLMLEANRKYIIFCGRVFEEILSNFIVKKETHTFKLKKNNGNDTENDFEIINIKLKHNNSEITACIAPQFAKQGYPVGRYGEKVRELYGKF